MIVRESHDLQLRHRPITHIPREILDPDVHPVLVGYVEIETRVFAVHVRGQKGLVPDIPWPSARSVDRIPRDELPIVAAGDVRALGEIPEVATRRRADIVVGNGPLGGAMVRDAVTVGLSSDRRLCRL